MNDANKHDAGKPRYDLLPPIPLEMASEVLAFGAEKYADWNWAKGMNWGRLYRAALSHLMAFWRGEDHDPESGKLHLAHALCCVMFLAHYAATGTGRDDRWRVSRERPGQLQWWSLNCLTCGYTQPVSSTEQQTAEENARQLASYFFCKCGMRNWKPQPEAVITPQRKGSAP